MTNWVLVKVNDFSDLNLENLKVKDSTKRKKKQNVKSKTIRYFKRLQTSYSSHFSGAKDDPGDECEEPKGKKSRKSTGPKKSQVKAKPKKTAAKSSTEANKKSTAGAEEQSEEEGCGKTPPNSPNSSSASDSSSDYEFGPAF